MELVFTYVCIEILLEHIFMTYVAVYNITHVLGRVINIYKNQIFVFDKYNY